MQTGASTCLPPMIVLIAGGKCTPVWPAPPKVTKADLPIFCQKEHCATIVKKFCVHLHQHPQIPTTNSLHIWHHRKFTMVLSKICMISATKMILCKSRHICEIGGTQLINGSCGLGQLMQQSICWRQPWSLRVYGIILSTGTFMSSTTHSWT